MITKTLTQLVTQTGLREPLRDGKAKEVAEATDQFLYRLVTPTGDEAAHLYKVAFLAGVFYATMC